MGCHFLLQGIFPTQRLNPCFLHWQADSLPLSYLGSHHHDDLLLLVSSSLVLPPSKPSFPHSQGQLMAKLTISLSCFKLLWDFPGGPGVKNLPSNAGDAGSIPGGRTKTPHTVRLLGLHAWSPLSLHAWSPQQEKHT